MRCRNIPPPAYQHLLINHVPIIGLAFAALSLVISLLIRSRPAQWIALALVSRGVPWLSTGPESAPTSRSAAWRMTRARTGSMSI